MAMAMIRDTKAHTMPRISELRTAYAIHQKRSCPREVVPKGYSSEGALSMGTTKVFLGSKGDTMAITAIATMNNKKTKRHGTCHRI
ncbi:MAG: hypothetical protein R2873_26170 [Caldilineaceae bacterium]